MIADKDTDEAYIISYEIKGKIFIRMFKPERNGPAVVHGFKSEHEALDFYEKSYAEAHRRGPTWSTGAMLMDIQLQPRIHHSLMREIKELVGSEPMLHRFTGDTVWGEMGLLCPDSEQVRRIPRER